MAPRTRKVVVLTRDKERHSRLVAEMEAKQTRVSIFETGEAALEAIRGDGADCVIVDPEFAEAVCTATQGSDDRLREMPFIVFSERPFSRKQSSELRRLARMRPLTAAETRERLEEVMRPILHPQVIMHSAQSRLGPRKLDAKDLEMLAGKKVLVVDDDVRNIFALTSLLERYKMHVVYADNGRAAIKTLEETPGIDVVLMDIMMPEMDGHDTTRAIRQIGRFQSLPIIALTARAMKGDREKCIEAGASDYIPKPVAPDQLLAQLCEWTVKAPAQETSPA